MIDKKITIKVDKMITYHNFSEAIETTHTDGSCHALSQSLLNYHGRGHIYLLVHSQVNTSQLRSVLLHSYYYDQGLYSDIIANYTTVDELIMTWGDRWDLSADTLTVIPLSQAADLDLTDFTNLSLTKVDNWIIQTILANRETIT